jgi:RimJ/RimL family protein N-acetyltransferase
MPIIYIDKNIYLRKFEDKDLGAIYKLKNDPKTAKFLGGFSIAYSRNDILEWINSVRNREKDIIWCIADNNDECIGQIGLYDINYRIGNAEIGIAISKNNINQGIGTKVHRKVIEFAFNEMNLNKVTALVLTLNKLSVSLYEKLGFTKEGEIRNYQYRQGEYINAYLYGLLKEEWSNS